MLCLAAKWRASPLFCAATIVAIISLWPAPAEAGAVSPTEPAEACQLADPFAISASPNRLETEVTLPSFPCQCSENDEIAGDAATAQPIMPGREEWNQLSFDGAVSVVSTRLPVTRGTDAEPGIRANDGNPVPLPPAAWTGMTGLLGLGAIAGIRSFRRLGH